MKKPWNRIDLPVYSVSSRREEEENMHLCTYVSAVSMQPKRFMVALYKGTRTLELVTSNPHFILQLLAEDQYRLTVLLGRMSGNDKDKIRTLEKRNLLNRWKGFPVLTGALAWMELKVIGSMDAGDHVMHLCDLITARNVQVGNPLTLDLLRRKKMIRN